MDFSDIRDLSDQDLLHARFDAARRLKELRGRAEPAFELSVELDQLEIEARRRGLIGSARAA